MNLLAIELYRLRIELSVPCRWGFFRPLVGRYAWALGLSWVKIGWVQPRLTSQDGYSNFTLRPSRRIVTSSGRVIVR